MTDEQPYQEPWREVAARPSFTAEDLLPLAEPADIPALLRVGDYLLVNNKPDNATAVAKACEQLDPEEPRAFILRIRAGLTKELDELLALVVPDVTAYPCSPVKLQKTA